MSKEPENYPEPDCGWCEDYGVIEIFHPSTDGQIGQRPCDNPSCVKRRAEAERERKAAWERGEYDTVPTYGGGPDGDCPF